MVKVIRKRKREKKKYQEEINVFDPNLKTPDLLATSHSSLTSDSFSLRSFSSFPFEEREGKEREIEREREREEKERESVTVNYCIKRLRREECFFPCFQKLLKGIFLPL